MNFVTSAEHVSVISHSAFHPIYIVSCVRTSYDDTLIFTITLHATIVYSVCIDTQSETPPHLLSCPSPPTLLQPIDIARSFVIQFSEAKHTVLGGQAYSVIDSGLPNMNQFYGKYTIYIFHQCRQ